MKQHDETLLSAAVDAVKSAEPSTTQISESARRVASRLGIENDVDLSSDSMTRTIDNCDDVRHLLSSYKAGTLSSSRSLLVEAHLRDCHSCRRQLKSGPAGAVVDWSTPKPVRSVTFRPAAFAWALAASFAFLACTFFVYRAYWQVPPGVRAEVQSIDGSAYRSPTRAIVRFGRATSLSEGDRLRTAAHRMPCFASLTDRPSKSTSAALSKWAPAAAT